MPELLEYTYKGALAGGAWGLMSGSMYAVVLVYFWFRDRNREPLELFEYADGKFSSSFPAVIALCVKVMIAMALWLAVFGVIIGAALYLDKLF